MFEVKVEKIEESKLKSMGVFSWPIWEKEASRFDWHYDETEACYIIKGKVKVRAKDGKIILFGAGDFVTFPKGLDCEWDIIEPVRKHYNFN